MGENEHIGGWFSLYQRNETLQLVRHWMWSEFLKIKTECFTHTKSWSHLLFSTGILVRILEVSLGEFRCKFLFQVDWRMKKTISTLPFYLSIGKKTVDIRIPMEFRPKSRWIRLMIFVKKCKIKLLIKLTCIKSVKLKLFI